MPSIFVLNRPRTWWLVAFVVALCVLSVGNYFAWRTVERPESGSASSQAPDARSSTQTTVKNTVGGYAFEYPTDWTVSKSGSVTEVTSSNDEVVVSVGFAPPGDLLVASDRFLALLSDSFAELELAGRQVGTTGGYLSITRTGRVVDEDGEELRFSAVTIEGDQQNLAIAVFAKTTSDPALSSTTNEIVASVQLLSD